MDTKHEALETADRCDSLASIFDAWSPDTYERAAALLRRQHQRIEELEKALRAFLDEIVPNDPNDPLWVNGRRALLSTTQQEDSQA